MADNKESFVGFIDGDGIIWSQGYGTSKSINVGIDNQAANELKADRDNCYEKAQKYLEEQYIINEQSNGIYGRPRPKTAEQIAQETADKQAEINREFLQAIKALKDEIKDLKKSNSNEEVVDNGRNTDSSSNVGKIPARSGTSLL